MPGRLRIYLAVGAASAVAVAGCGAGTQGVSSGKIIAALKMKKVLGNYAIDGNPLCSVSKLLHNSSEVSDASKTRSVIASRDGTVGVQIIRPFAPSCKRKAERKLDRLASGRPKSHGHGGRSRHGR
jgi:hypothetical protein